MRYIMLDRITTLEPPEVARGLKCVSLAEDVHEHHFPGYPIFPGALTLEAMAQLGGVLLEATMRQQRGTDDLHAILTIVERAKFRQMVRPGDRLELEARALRASELGGQVEATAMIDGARAAEATLSFAFAQVHDPRLLQMRRDVLHTWLGGSIQAPELPVEEP